MRLLFKGVRRGWCLGGEQFRQELLAQVDRQLGALHFGAERAESQAERAERLVREELKRLGWTETDLAARRKADPDKVRLAERLREDTLVTLAWIAGRLQTGSVAWLNNRLYLLRQGRLKKMIIGPDPYSQGAAPRPAPHRDHGGVQGRAGQRDRA